MLIPDDKSIILDLNGHTVSYVDTYGDCSNVMILNLGNLTINDSSKGGGKLTYKPIAGSSSSTYCYSTIINCGTLTINGGTFSDIGKTNDAETNLASFLAEGRLLVKNADGTYTVSPANDVMSGSVINVTAAQAQDVLDGKFGDITGKTINPSVRESFPPKVWRFDTPERLALCHSKPRPAFGNSWRFVKP